MTLRSRLTLTTLLCVALLVAVPPAAASTSGWYMHYDSTTDSTSLRSDAPNGAIPLSIADGQRRVFAEPTGATTTLNPAGTWPYSIKLEKAQPHAQNFTISVGKVAAAAGSPFQPFASVTNVADKIAYTGNITVPNGFSLAPGERLAIEVYNAPSTAKVGPAAKAIQVMVNDPTARSFTPPVTMANYPNPPNTPPTIAAKSDVVAEATSASGAVVTYTAPSTSDFEDGSGTATCTPASGAQFALGETTVTCTATDSHGASATPTTFKVVVRDTTAPTIASTSDVTAEATSASGAIVSYASPSTTDAVGGSGTATCSPASGTQFALGTTTVTCTASDAAGNTATKTFGVIVRDTTPPVIADPIDIFAPATDEDSGIVMYDAPGTTDAVDGSGFATCSPASGSDFPIGNTVVTCTATDAAGNEAQWKSFTVSVAAAGGEPALPTPELPTAALAGLGLVGLIALGRRGLLG